MMMTWHAMSQQDVATIVNIMTHECNETQYIQLLYECYNFRFLVII
jgi:hypothetical protein